MSATFTISSRRLCTVAMGCVLLAVTSPIEAIPTVISNDVYIANPVSTSTPQDWPLDLVRNMSQTTDLREFIMKFVEDERICTSKTLHELIVGKNTSDISAHLWWNKRCGGIRGVGKKVSSFPESTLIRYRRKSSNRRSTSQSPDMTQSDRQKLDKLIKNKKVQCNPKKSVVELPNDEKPLVMLKPSCVYIKQCGGCCDSPLLECLPEKVKERKFKVLAIEKKVNNKIRFPSSQTLKTIRVQEHKKCRCQCKERAEHCTEHQVYDEGACRCTCPSHVSRSCSDDKIWNERQCSCVCRDVSDCTTGRYFDDNTCRCLRT
ncbi:vascular endothelial growth factor A-like isoform X2 [Penaeus japonicus]|uniref:vascular endothelial growth factor A-like isoform X2 n=1 Tax=Penaeus japonicus TaxID=27405 RepID=UPI001C712431|nr:vascular endothelial growth factor A-like isoform X2 [Penaeus japonicus]